jgi:hypothetical protein
MQQNNSNRPKGFEPFANTAKLACPCSYTGSWRLLSTSTHSAYITMTLIVLQSVLSVDFIRATKPFGAVLERNQAV